MHIKVLKPSTVVKGKNSATIFWLLFTIMTVCTWVHDCKSIVNELSPDYIQTWTELDCLHICIGDHIYCKNVCCFNQLQLHQLQCA